MLAKQRLLPYLILIAGSIALRSATALFFHQPGYMDAYYNYIVGDSLYRGSGFTEGVIWNYLSVPSQVIHPSNLYWMPMTSLAIYASFLVFGPSFFASQFPFIVASSAMPALAFYLGRDLFRGERYAWSMALFTVFSGVFAAYWSLPDNLPLFAVFSAAALILSYKGLRDSAWYLPAAGAFVGLAYLTRADGILLLAAIGAAVIIRGVRATSRERALLLGGLAGAGAMALAVVSPWLYHNVAVSGSLMPADGTKTIFLREYNDIFRYAGGLTSGYYFNFDQPSADWGLSQILGSKASALLQNLLVIGRPALVFLTPVFLFGLLCRVDRVGWKGALTGQLAPRAGDSLWRRVEFLPFLCYAVVLYLVMSLLFTFPSPRGSTMHSSGGLLPFVAGAIVVGIDGLARQLSRKYRPVAEAGRRRVYLGIAIAGAIVMTVGFTYQMAATWDNHYRDYVELSQWMQSHGDPTKPVILADPPGYYYVSHTPALVVASDGIGANLEVAKRYGARYLVVEAARPASLNDLYDGKVSDPHLKLAADLGKTRIFEILE